MSSTCTYYRKWSASEKEQENALTLKRPCLVYAVTPAPRHPSSTLSTPPVLPPCTSDTNGLLLLKPMVEALQPGLEIMTRHSAILGLECRDLLPELLRYNVAHVREVPEALLQGVHRGALCQVR